MWVRTRWFTEVLKKLLRHPSVALSYGYGKPKSQSILMHCGVMALPWPDARIAMVDHWLLSFGPDTFRRQTKILDSIPFGRRNPQFPQAFLSNIGRRPHPRRVALSQRHRQKWENGGLEHQFYGSRYWKQASQLIFMFFWGLKLPTSQNPVVMIMFTGFKWLFYGIMGVKQCQKQPMTGNGKRTTCMNIFWDGLW